MKTADNHARQLERAALAITENKRLRESVELLEKSLAGAHNDKERLQSHISELESENWALTEQLRTVADQKKW